MLDHEQERDEDADDEERDGDRRGARQTPRPSRRDGHADLGASATATALAGALATPLRRVVAAAIAWSIVTPDMVPRTPHERLVPFPACGGLIRDARLPHDEAVPGFELTAAAPDFEVDSRRHGNAPHPRTA